MSAVTAFRRTKIIFTLGPATESEEILEKMLLAGADIVRLNMAHATHDWTRAVIRRIRTLSQRLGREVAIIMDIKGPEIRTGDVEVPIELKAGESFDFHARPSASCHNGREPAEAGKVRRLCLSIGRDSRQRPKLISRVNDARTKHRFVFGDAGTAMSRKHSRAWNSRYAMQVRACSRMNWGRRAHPCTRLPVYRPIT